MKIKLNFFNRFIFGGIILILLSKMDFLNFRGKIGVLIMANIFIFYLIMNLLPLFIYLFNLEIRRKNYFTLPIMTFLLLIYILLILIDPSKYSILKIGILTRIFFSYFPLHIYNFYIKKE